MVSSSMTARLLLVCVVLAMALRGARLKEIEDSGWAIRSLVIIDESYMDTGDVAAPANVIADDTGNSSVRVRRSIPFVLPGKFIMAAKFGNMVGKGTSMLKSAGSWMKGAGSSIGTGATVIASVVIAINGIIGLVRTKAATEEARKQFEEQMELSTASLCDVICVTPWGPWDRCTARCGGGFTTRNRTRYASGRCEDHDCRHPLTESALCNMECPNAGTPWTVGGGCDCLPGIAGDCCDNYMTCDYPGSFPNGELSVNSPALYGYVAHYECDEGFALVGESYQLCSETGGWSREKPKCERLDCGEPGEPENGELINSGSPTTFGNIAAYRCNEGYELSGPDIRECTYMGGRNGTWDAFTPLCIPISCGQPNLPMYAEVTGDGFMLGDTLTFSCLPGFRLVGSEERTCLSHGTWSGNEPICQGIMCETPFPPDHGRIARPQENYPFGSTVRFFCDTGYQLDGRDTMRCLEDPEENYIGPGGVWDAVEPTCQAAVCEDLGDLENGVKDGQFMVFPNSVNFKCFPGYVLRGMSTISCGPNGAWSSRKPQCLACPANTYRANSETLTECIPCPRNSATLTEASTSVHACLCIEGYSRDAEGNCVQIVCPELVAPEFGSMDECDNHYNGRCHFNCGRGHILESGSAERICDENGRWTGSNPVCAPCPKDSFKSNMRSCLPCPRHALTEGPGGERENCVCKPGYHGDSAGECQDDDECETNDGNGPCSEACENSGGSYRCLCLIPGHVIDPHDRNTCKVESTCRNLTRDDAPQNGGLVCHWYHEENSQQCDARCNPGYGFPKGGNDYVYCGAETTFEWSHERKEEVIPPCIEEVFADVQLAGNTTYFVRACDDLTPQEQEDVKRQFAQKLTDWGICKKRNTSICEMKDVGIICGHTTRRVRRGVMETVQEIDFKFKIKAMKLEENVVNCSTICPLLRIPEHRCSALCVRVYRRFLTAAVMFSKQQLETIFADRDAARFDVAARHFEPKPESLHTSDVQNMCPPGMRAEGENCVPCGPGTIYNAHNGSCSDCPRGTYQPEYKGMTCMRCPSGTMSHLSGAAQCDPCPPGRYGDFCLGQCQTCIHGDCNSQNGYCDCHSGWEGDNCDVDQDGCRNVDVCEPGVNCLDVPAPGTGYSCDI